MGSEEMKCKHLSDSFDEICTNADSPCCADFCPVTYYPEICRYAEYEGCQPVQCVDCRFHAEPENAAQKGFYCTALKPQDAIGLWMTNDKELMQCDLYQGKDETVEKSKLLPCPFCGGKPFQFCTQHETIIMCRNYSTKHQIMVSGKDDREASERWNERV